MSRNLRQPGPPNPSANPTFSDIVSARLSRRDLLGGAARPPRSSRDCHAAAARAQGAPPAVTFTPIAPSTDDVLRVPAGLRGDRALSLGRSRRRPGRHAGVPLGRLQQRRRPGAPGGHAPRRHALLPAPAGLGRLELTACWSMNHEYLDEGLLFPDGQKTWTAEKVAKAQNAVGVSVIEVEDTGRRVARGRAFALRPPHHRADPVPRQRTGGRPRPHADGGGPGRAPRAGHLQRLRPRLDAVGHLPHLRGELALPLREQRD